MTANTFAALGERLTQALIQGDAALYRSVMALPLRIEPRGGAPYVLTDRAALDSDFALYHAAIRTAGVTDILREVREVRAGAAPGTFRVLFRVHLMARAFRLADPFPSEMLMVPGPDGMRIAEIISAPEHIAWTLGAGHLGLGEGLI